MENEESDAGTAAIAAIRMAIVTIMLLYASQPKAIVLKPDAAYINHLVHITQYQTTKAKVSWYGGRFNGRRTANGEIYYKDSLTCAHNTLPFNTIVKVMLDGETVSVRVNDRGELYGRDFDLSEGAARALGMIDRGVATVDIETRR